MNDDILQNTNSNYICVVINDFSSSNHSKIIKLKNENNGVNIPYQIWNRIPFEILRGPEMLWR